jgi:hypothetical protein
MADWNCRMAAVSKQYSKASIGWASGLELVLAALNIQSTMKGRLYMSRF